MPLKFQVDPAIDEDVTDEVVKAEAQALCDYLDTRKKGPVVSALSLIWVTEAISKKYGLEIDKFKIPDEEEVN